MKPTKHLWALAATLCLALGLHAQTTYYWIGSGGSWATAGNWSLSSGGSAATVAPGATDIAVFDANGGDCTLAANAAIGELVLDDDYANTLDLDGHSLSVAGGFTQHAGTFQGGSAAVGIGGTLHLIGGDYRATTGTTTVGADIIEEGEYLYPQGGKFVLTGTGALIDITTYFYDLEIGTGASAELSNGMAVAHNLHLGGPLYAGEHTVFIGSSSATAITGGSGIYLALGAEAYGIVYWGIGESTGTYTVPMLATPTGPVIPVAMDVTTAGDAGTGPYDGFVMFLCIELDDTKPQDMLPNGGYYNATGGNNADMNINRLWGLVLSGYDVSPGFDLGLAYADADLTGIIATEANLRGQVHDEKHWTGTMGTLNATANTLALTGLSLPTDGRASFVTLVDNTSPNKSTYGGNTGLTCADAVELDSIVLGETDIVMVDDEMWFKFTNDKLYEWRAIFRTSETIFADSAKLYLADSCGLTSLTKNWTKVLQAHHLNLGIYTDSAYYVRIYRQGGNRLISFNKSTNPVIECIAEKDSLADLRSAPTSCDFSYYNIDNPLKVIYLNFHFLLKDDGTGNFNEANDGDGNISQFYINGYSVAQQYLANLNDVADSNQYFKYILAGTPNDSCIALGQVLDTILNIPALPTRYSYAIYKDTSVSGDSGIYFHRNTQLYLSEDVGAKKSLLSVHGEKVIDVFFVEPSPGSGATGRSWGAPSTAVDVYGLYKEYLNARDAVTNNRTFPFWARMGLLRHELGHAIGLMHTSFENGTSCGLLDTCDDTYDVSTLCGCPFVGSNNVMDYGGGALFITPCQLEIIHKTFSSHTAVAYQDTAWCAYNMVPTIIDSNTTAVWDSNLTMIGDVIVEPGASLTIKCFVRMPQGSRIVVKRGGKLIIDGGTVLPICNDRTWVGIEVWGFDTLPHPTLTSVISGTYPSSYNHHGVVIVKNEGYVQSAETGIYVGKRNNSNGYERPYSGGIVFIQSGSVLLNNIVAIDFLPFSLTTVSRIENSKIYISPHPQSQSGYMGVRMNLIKGLTINNVDFWGLFNPSLTTTHNSQYGIFSFDSQFLCDSSHFYRLSHGLINIGSKSHFPVTKVSNNQFDCAVGIAAYGDEYNIYRNNGFIPQSTLQHVTGMVMYGSNAFRLEKNKFTESTEDGVDVELLYISNTGFMANEVKGNTLEFIGFNENARGAVSAQNNAGLKFRCNDFTFNSFPIGLQKKYAGNLDIYGPIAEMQGLCGTNQSPANNYFADDCGFSSTTGIHIFTNPGVPYFAYRFLDNNTRFEPDTGCVKMGSLFDVIPCAQVGTSTDYCPDRYGLVSITSGWVTAKGDLIFARGRIGTAAGVLDQANTAGLVSFVGSGDAGVVLDSLYGMGMLSDEVLMALIHRTPMLDADSVAHILINNAPHSNLLLMSLAEREVSIPTDSLDKIYEYQDSTSARKVAVDTLGYWRNELELVYNALLFIADDDKYTTYTIDSVIALLEEETDVNLRLKLADLYMANGQYSEAEAVWDSIPIYYNETRQHINLRRKQLDMAENGLTLEDLNGDELGNIADIAGSNTKAAWQAKAMLIALGLDSILIDIEDRIYSSPKAGSEEFLTEQSNDKESTWLRLYPNPANNTVTLDYSLQEDQVGAIFSIYDLFGKTIGSYKAGGTSGSITVDISGLPNGIYICNLQHQTTRLWQEKMVIVR